MVQDHLHHNCCTCWHWSYTTSAAQAERVGGRGETERKEGQGEREFKKENGRLCVYARNEAPDCQKKFL